MAHRILRWLTDKPCIPTVPRQAASPTDSSHGKDQALRHTASDSDEDIYLLPAPSENVGQGQGSSTPPAKLPAALLTHLKVILTLCCEQGRMLRSSVWAHWSAETFVLDLNTFWDSSHVLCWWVSLKAIVHSKMKTHYYSMDYFNNVLTTFLCLERVSCIDVYGGSESSRSSSKI